MSKAPIVVKVDFTALSPRVRLLGMVFDSPRSTRLLVADDSITLQKVIKLALSSNNPVSYEIRAVSNGDEAIEQMELFKPDLILIDLNLPSQNAYTFKEYLNQNPATAKIPVILKVGIRNEKIDEERFKSLGFKGRLEMPFDPSHLKQVLLKAHSEVKNDTPPHVPSEDPMAFTGTEFETSTEIQFDDPPVFDSEPEVTLPPLDLENTFSGVLKPTMPASPLAESSDLDIKSLTENTVKLSQLDGMDEWSIQEKNSKKPPELPTLDFGKTQPEQAISRIDLEPFPFEDSQQEIDPTVTSETRIIQAAKKELSSLLSDKSNEPLFHLPPKMIPTPPPVPLYQGVSPETQQQLNKLIEGEVKKILPEIAERIVKQELKKLLDQIQ